MIRSAFIWANTKQEHQIQYSGEWLTEKCVDTSCSCLSFTFFWLVYSNFKVHYVTKPQTVNHIQYSLPLDPGPGVIWFQKVMRRSECSMPSQLNMLNKWENKSISHISFIAFSHRIGWKLVDISKWPGSKFNMMPLKVEMSAVEYVVVILKLAEIENNWKTYSRTVNILTAKSHVK